MSERPDLEATTTAPARASLVRRILWRWLRLWLVMEIAFGAVVLYQALRAGVVAYRDAETIENVVQYSALMLAAALAVAVTDVLSGEDK